MGSRATVQMKDFHPVTLPARIAARMPVKMPAKIPAKLPVKLPARIISVAVALLLACTLLPLPAIASFAATAEDQLILDYQNQINALEQRINEIKATAWGAASENAHEITTLELQLAQAKDDLLTLPGVFASLAAAQSAWTAANQQAWDVYAAAALALSGIANYNAELAKYDEGVMTVNVTQSTAGGSFLRIYQRVYDYTISGGGEYWRALVGIGDTQNSYSTGVLSSPGINSETVWNTLRTAQDNCFPWYLYQETGNLALLNTRLYVSSFGGGAVAINNYADFWQPNKLWQTTST